MSIEVYSDFVCPWCYIGHRKLKNALADLSPDARPKITWRAYQLDSNASNVPDQTAAKAMLGWYSSVEEAEARIAQIISTGKDEGLDLNLHRALPVNTFDAHRLIHFAQGTLQAEMLRERLFRAYHSEGLNIADLDVLAGIALEAGIEQAEARRFQQSDRFGDAVREDLSRGSQQGIRGVPSLVIDGGQPVSVNQDGLALRDLLKRALH
ncbi:DsbA family oxidoreductase [Puniceibacterium sp. IMCC21224]|uniref:DsbA family oxidoreductase n=1 Tax=Puniceibacterium sp. IMCC21224 TaxID=1618204 RepID=UPI00064D816E|nr:DsbA family oxidoreductase [Puniceibacterium sp. IMCC21224]KMK64480.1 putative dithiol-disulfide isomerase involved in polyketide biosynthesis [Puniceibacterium sp. IMCC21224]